MTFDDKNVKKNTQTYKKIFMSIEHECAIIQRTNQYFALSLEEDMKINSNHGKKG